jgi:hypothetical protein
MVNKGVGAGWKMLVKRKFSVVQIISVTVAILSALHTVWLASQMNVLRLNCGSTVIGGKSFSLLGAQRRDYENMPWLQIVVLSSNNSKNLMHSISSLVEELPHSTDPMYGKITILVVNHDDSADEFDQVR